MGSLFRWLDFHGLTNGAVVFDRPAEQSTSGEARCDGGFRLAQATSRQLVRRLKQHGLKALKEQFKGVSVVGINQEARWRAVFNAEASVRTLCWERLAARRAQGAAR